MIEPAKLRLGSIKPRGFYWLCPVFTEFLWHIVVNHSCSKQIRLLSTWTSLWAHNSGFTHGAVNSVLRSNHKCLSMSWFSVRVMQISKCMMNNGSPLIKLKCETVLYRFFYMTNTGPNSICSHFLIYQQLYTLSRLSTSYWHLNAILGQGQPGLMRWILGRVMPQM